MKIRINNVIEARRIVAEEFGEDVSDWQWIPTVDLARDILDDRFRKDYAAELAKGKGGAA